MRTVSLNVRLAEDAPAHDMIDAVLFLIRHPRLAEPIRLSTDNTERLSLWPRLTYCTRSTWQTEDGSPFLFIVAAATIPDEGDDAPASASITIEDVEDEMAGVVMRNPERATIDMALVKANEPDFPIAQWRGMEIAAVDIGAGLITFDLTAEPILEEYDPKDSMSRDRFPGLFS